MRQQMKKIFIFPLVTIILFTSNAFAASHTIYYKLESWSDWTKGSTYRSEKACKEAAARMDWVYQAKCVL
jgi:hypothetical protein